MHSTFLEYPLDEFKQMDINTRLQIWQATAEKLARLKAFEAERRINLFNTIFPVPLEGTNTFELGNDYLLKAVNKFNYKVEDTLDMKRIINKIAMQRKEASFAERLVKWEPRLSLTHYKALSEDEHKLFDPFVTKKPGLPDLKILAPGDEGNKR